MEINIFDDPSRVPQPRDKIKIEALNVQPYPDGRRVRVDVRVTAFQERPNLLLLALDENGRTVNELNVIATMHANMEFTMHMRHKPDPAGSYVLVAELFYESRNPPQDRKETTFTIVPQADDDLA